jgi:hypothetical protein
MPVRRALQSESRARCQTRLHRQVGVLESQRLPRVDDGPKSLDSLARTSKTLAGAGDLGSGQRTFGSNQRPNPESNFLARFADNPARHGNLALTGRNSGPLDCAVWHRLIPVSGSSGNPSWKQRNEGSWTKCQATGTLVKQGKSLEARDQRPRRPLR